jgi:glycosyltransferase involved in cell wall biosynthesis
MRIAYVLQQRRPMLEGGASAYVYHAAHRMAAMGHSVYLVTDELDGPLGTLEHLESSVTLVATRPPVERRHTISPDLGYSDRVRETLVSLNEQARLDIVEFAGSTAEAFTTIRAKKLLNELADSTLISRLRAPMGSSREKTSSLLPITIHESILSYGEEYVVKHADILTSASSNLIRDVASIRGPKPTLVTPNPVAPLLPTTDPSGIETRSPRSFLYVGPVDCRDHLDLIISTATHLLSVDPTFVFEIYGDDPSAEPLAHPSERYLFENAPPGVRQRMFARTRATPAQLHAAFSRATYCLILATAEDWFYRTLNAIAYGCVVVTGSNPIANGLLQGSTAALVADPCDGRGIAEVILASGDGLPQRREISLAAHRQIAELSDDSDGNERALVDLLARIHRRDWVCSKSAGPKVSVVIPLFNQGAYLRQAVDSALASTYENMEVVVVNDGSTDSSTVNEFDQLDGVVKVSQDNAGLAAARNAGIAASSGQFILPLDADDLIHPSYVELAVDAMLNNSDLSYLSCYSRNFGEFSSTYAPIGSIPSLMLLVNTDGRCTNMYERSALESVGCYDDDQKYYEDWDLLISLNKQGLKGDVLPAELFYYRRHRDSMIYRHVNARRAELVQQLMLKHHDVLSSHWESIVLNLTYLWKSNVEVNQSVDHASRGKWPTMDPGASIVADLRPADWGVALSRGSR